MNASPTEVQKALAGADYPASRDELIKLAEDNDASEEVIEDLSSIEDDEYSGPAEVMAHLGGGGDDLEGDSYEDEE